MSQIRLSRREAETGDLPPVCMHCGADADRLVPRNYHWSPLVFPPLLRLILTRRMYVQVPACLRHASTRLWNGPSLWGECRPTHIDANGITLAGVSPDFDIALHDYRRGHGPEWDDEGRHRARRAPPPRVRSGGGVGIVLGVVALVFGLLVAVPLLFAGVALVMLLVLRPGPGPLPPAGPPEAAEEVRPEAVAGLVGAPAGGDHAGLAGLAFLVNGSPDRVAPEGPDAVAEPPLKAAPAAELNRALADLGDRNAFAASRAARKLAHWRPDEGRRREVARSLERLLRDPNPQAREAAAAALAVWGAEDSVAPLTALLDDPFVGPRREALKALAALKADDAAEAVAKRLANSQDRENARQALVAMGPAAETAVLPLLAGRDAQARVEACRVLRAVGGRDSITALQQAARDSNPSLAREAQAALRAVEMRVE